MKTELVRGDVVGDGGWVIAARGGFGVLRFPVLQSSDI